MEKVEKLVATRGQYQKQVEKSVFGQPHVETTHNVLSLRHLSDKYYICAIKKIVR